MGPQTSQFLWGNDWESPGCTCATARASARRNTIDRLIAENLLCHLPRSNSQRVLSVSFTWPVAVHTSLCNFTGTARTHSEPIVRSLSASVWTRSRVPLGTIRELSLACLVIRMELSSQPGSHRRRPPPPPMTRQLEIIRFAGGGGGSHCW